MASFKERLFDFLYKEGAYDGAAIDITQFVKAAFNSPTGEEELNAIRRRLDTFNNLGYISLTQSPHSIGENQNGTLHNFDNVIITAGLEDKGIDYVNEGKINASVTRTNWMTQVNMVITAILTIIVVSIQICSNNREKAREIREVNKIDLDSIRQIQYTKHEESVDSLLRQIIPCLQCSSKDSLK